MLSNMFGFLKKKIISRFLFLSFHLIQDVFYLNCRFVSSLLCSIYFKRFSLLERNNVSQNKRLKIPSKVKCNNKKNGGKNCLKYRTIEKILDLEIGFDSDQIDPTYMPFLRGLSLFLTILKSGRASGSSAQHSIRQSRTKWKQFSNWFNGGLR